MALLVASLLLAALAPVMTRKFGDNVNVSGVGNGAKSDYTRLFDKDTEWNIPNGVNVVNITAIGGGGAGGGASYGFQEFTSTTNNWIVPNGVTKIRVFMTGAGGGGASGGAGIKTEYGNLPTIPATNTIIAIAGIDTFTNRVAPPNTYIAPTLPSICKSKTNKWVLSASNTVEIIPNAYIPKIGGNGQATVNITKVTACGGGGGGGGYSGGGGGSGGYLADQTLNISDTANNIIVAVGSGGNTKGGSGGIGAGTGGANGGSNTTLKADNGNGSAGSFPGEHGGGGGGGGSAILHNKNIVFEVGGGGGGAGGCYAYAQSSPMACHSGGGGGGGGAGAGGGGGDGYVYTKYTSSSGGLWCGSGGTSNGVAGSGRTTHNNGGNGNGGGGGGGAGCYTDAYASGSGSYGAGGPSASGGGRGGGSFNGRNGYAYGGGGGGGQNGMGGYGGPTGTGGKLSSSIFSTSTNCSGGNSGANGLPGAMKLWYSASSVVNGLKCEYYTKSNSGGGGGAGQVWLGEISVTPGQKLSFNVGIGGEGTSNYGSSGYGRNGGNGGDTSIVSNGVSIASVSGGKGGKYINSDNESEISSNSIGIGGGIKKSSFSNNTKYVNWLNLNTTNNPPGQSGLKASTPANGAGGGRGGNTISKNNTLVLGGLGGGAQSNGVDTLSSNYGAGGGGGGGVVNEGGTPGHGGKGANGYIYIEWGSTNGGGGASGQVVEKKAVWVTPGTKIKINVGKGGEGKDILSELNGVSGQFGQKGSSGGNTIVSIPNEEIITALGGEGGYPGGSSHGIGGNGGDEANESIGGNKNNMITENSIPGYNGNDDFGGNGGYIMKEICPLLYELNKASYGGCGGSNPSTNGCYPSTGPMGSKGYGIGAGGGGGSVKDNQAHVGGNGSDGGVIIEWSN